ncbi:MAG: TonB-dependent receptor, partial [Acidobacteria bacterium]|nr:TonB-dependent receptor [Acidobacteriota bacterium]
MKRWVGGRSIVVLLAVMLFPVAVLGQATGSVRGVVKDPTGAVLPGANVTLTNKATGVSVQMVTNETGAYSFPAVTPGQYTLAFDMSGFKKAVKDNVIVNVAEVAVFDPVLEIGDVTQEVTVMDELPLVQTTNVELGRVVEEVMVTAVPLSARNFTQILALSPGVVSDVPNAGAYGRNSVNISANGARPWENSISLNGLSADNINSLGFDDATDKTGIAVPSPDAIQEFKVQTGLYDAEFGRQGGANVTIITKSGSNDLHGALFEFFRNDALNANEFFRNRNGLGKGVLKQNQFGGTLAGPIVKDRTFFFISYQGTRQRNGVSNDATRNVFLPPITDDRSPATLGRQFGGRSGQFGGVAVAPNGSNINPVALALLNTKFPNGDWLVPTPQQILPNGSGFSTFSIPIKFREDQYMLNIDHAFPGGDRIAVKTFLANLPTRVPFGIGSSLPGMPEEGKKSNINTAIIYTNTFSPRILNEARIGYARNYLRQIQNEPFTSSQFGITRPVEEFDRMPLIDVSGNFAIGPPQNADNGIIIHSYEASDTLHIMKGRQDIRLGANVQPNQVTRYLAFLNRGRINFSSFPDFLLGMSAAQNGSSFSNISAATAANGINGRHPRFSNYAAFIQDDIRMSDRLTVNVGLRWQYYGSEIDKHGRKGNFDRRKAIYGPLPAEGTLAGFVVPANASEERLGRLNSLPPDFMLPTKSLLDNDSRISFAPRLGIAWRPIESAQDFVVRTGYGVYWSMLAGTNFEQQSFDPWMITTRAGGNFLPTSTFQNPYVAPPATNQLPFYRPLVPGQSDRSFLSMDPTLRKPYVQQWTLNLQYGLSRYLFELSYAGSKSTHLQSFMNPNQALLASPERPVNGQTTNTVANVNLRTPLLSWTTGGLREFQGGFNANYHSMQFSVKKQYSQGLTFLSAYTWSHAIDDVSASGGGRNQPLGGYTGNYYNRRENRGSSDFDRTHRLILSYVWEIPGFASNGLN